MRSEALEKALAPYAAFEDGKRLRAGFTTGSAAAAAAFAAATLLFSGERSEAVLLQTPVGALLPIPIESAEFIDEGGIAEPQGKASAAKVPLRRRERRKLRRRTLRRFRWNFVAAWGWAG